MNYLWLELKHFLRPKSVKVLLVAFILMCAWAVGNGYWQMQLEQTTTAIADERFAEQWHHWQEQADQSYDAANTAGYAGYYTSMPTVQSYSALTALFPGLRPDYNSHMRVRLLALQGQMNDSAMINHGFSPFGFLTLDFIWAYLLPILIGIFCINVMADDVDNRRWHLMSQLAGSGWRLVWGRLLARFLSLAFIHAAILLFAIWMLEGLAATEALILFACILLYQSVWFAIAALIVALKRSRHHNLLMYLGCWIVFSFLIPGLLYQARLNPDELGLGIDKMVQQRESMNNSWDEDKQAELNRYLEAHPQWSETEPLPKGFHWKWYYAMQQRSDEQVATQLEGLKIRRYDSYRQLLAFSWLSPVSSMQALLWRLGESDLLAYQQYLDDLEHYHTQLENFYFPYLFFDQSLDSQALNQVPRFTENNKDYSMNLNVLMQLSAYLFITFFLLGIAITLCWRMFSINVKA